MTPIERTTLRKWVGLGAFLVLVVVIILDGVDPIQFTLRRMAVDALVIIILTFLGSELIERTVNGGT